MRLFDFRLGKKEYRLHMHIPNALWWGMLCIILLITMSMSFLPNAIQISFGLFLSLGVFRTAILYDNMTCGCCGQKIDKSKQ